MSVRVSLEADTMALASLKQHQALAGERTSTAKSTLNGTGEAADSNFRDSLQEHFDAPNSEDAASEAVSPDAKATSSSSAPPTAMSTSDCADLKQGPAGHADRNANKLDKNGRAKLIAPGGVQKQFSIIREHKTTVAAVGSSAKKSALDESTNTRANGFGAAPDVVPLTNPEAAVTAPNQSGPLAALSQFSTDVGANGSLALDPQGNSNASSSPLPNSPATAAQEMASGAWPDTSTDTQSAVTQVKKPTLIQGTGGAAPIRDMPPGPQVDEPAGESEVFNNLDSVGETVKQVGFNETNLSNNGQAVSTSQLPAKGTAENRVLSAPRVEHKNGDLAQSPSDTSLFEALRDMNSPAESMATAGTAGSTDAVGSDGKSKLTSWRLAAGSSRAQTHKEDPPGSSFAFANHSQNLAQNAEVTNAVSTPHKVLDTISSDNRLQDTFTSLELAARNETGAFNWTRSQHLQAEAGYQDPALGWIGVRAESSGGVLHATLVPSSSDAAQALSAHIAGLHTYLAESRTPVETLTLASFGGNAQQFAGQDSGQGTHQGTGQHAGQDNVSDNASGSALDPQSMSPPISKSAPREAPISDEVFTRSNSGSGSGGVHISVIA